MSFFDKVRDEEKQIEGKKTCKQQHDQTYGELRTPQIDCNGNKQVKDCSIDGKQNDEGWDTYP